MIPPVSKPLSFLSSSALEEESDVVDPDDGMLAPESQAVEYAVVHTVSNVAEPAQFVVVTRVVVATGTTAVLCKGMVDCASQVSQ